MTKLVFNVWEVSCRSCSNVIHTCLTVINIVSKGKAWRRSCA